MKSVQLRNIAFLIVTIHLSFSLILVYNITVLNLYRYFQSMLVQTSIKQVNQDWKEANMLGHLS